MQNFFISTTNQAHPIAQQLEISLHFQNKQEKQNAVCFFSTDFLLFKVNGHFYQLKRKCQIKPIFDGKNVKTLIIENSQSIDKGLVQLKCKNDQNLQILYHGLTRILSHKGFNDYFKVLKRLGRGNFATVYLTEHKFTGKKIAMKVFSKEGHKLQYKGQESLENEIRTLKTLEHPNIIKFYGLYETEALLYVATQYISGGTLQEMIMSKFSHSGEKINKVFKDVLTGLAYLSEKNIMHRDIKPQNILYRDQDDNWVISDFGLATTAQKDYLNYGKCGTMGYIAPEIMKLSISSQAVENQTYNQSCDVYSFGIIAYTLIIGSLPFKVQSQNFFDKKIVWVLFQRQQCKNIPKNIIDFLKLLLQQNPKKRITAKDALHQSFFSDNTISESLFEYNENRRNERYDRILKIANN